MDETILRFRAMLAGWQAFKTDPESGTFYAFSRGVKVFERYMAEHELEERYRYEQARGGTE